MEDIQFCYLRHQFTGHPIGVLAFRQSQTEADTIEVASSLCRQRSLFEARLARFDETDEDIADISHIVVRRVARDPSGDMWKADVGRALARDRLREGTLRVDVTLKSLTELRSACDAEPECAEQMMGEFLADVLAGLHPSRDGFIEFNDACTVSFLNSMGRMFDRKADPLVGAETIVVKS